MKTASGFPVAVALAALLTVPVAEAGSIWAKGAARTRALHTDDTARKTGDMLTIIIEEQSTVENESSRNLSKNSSRDATVTGNLDILKYLNKYTGQLFNVPQMSLDTESKTEFSGTTDFDSKRKVTDQVTVTVADVLPNGNLVVVGTRDREVEGDRQTVQISGVVRPSDITFANTVTSKQVAEFKLVLKHKGRENRFTKPGWMGRLMNIINPF